MIRIEDYPYSGLPFTPTVIEYLWKYLPKNEFVLLRDISSLAFGIHKHNGGLDPSGKGRIRNKGRSDEFECIVDGSVSLMLTRKKKEGCAEVFSKGQTARWKLFDSPKPSNLETPTLNPTIESEEPAPYTTTKTIDKTPESEPLTIAK